MSVFEEPLHQSLLNAPIGICLLDAKTFMAELVNDKFLEIAGKPREAILGKWYWEPFSEVREYYEQALKDVVTTGEAYHADEVKMMLIRQGKEEWVFVTFVYSPIKNSAGEVTKVTVWVLENTHQVKERERMDQARQLLEVERDRLTRFFLQLPAGVCILSGPDLVYEMVNPSYQKMLPGRKLLGRPIFDALPELQGTSFERDLLKVYNTGIPYSVNELMIPISEVEGGPTAERYFTFEYQARRDENENIDGVVNFAVEVTEQVRARTKIELSEKHFRHMADLVPVKISNTLPKGEVTFFNKQWLDFSGMSFEDTRDFGYQQMMHPDEMPEFRKRLKVAAHTGEPLIMEMRFKNRKGQYIWHLNIASPIMDDNGEIKMWVGSTTDIQHLKDEEQRKSDFISMLSHELKTPVTSIKGYVQVLTRIIEKQDQELSAEKLLPSLQRVNKLVNQLTLLIKDMLDLTRIESGRLELQTLEFSLNDLIKSVVEDFKFTHTTHVINVRHDALCIVRFDRNKIAQVLINFISNAIKYSPLASQVDVRVYKTDEGEVAVSVKDYGIGIDKELQSRIFERFYRVEGHSGEMFTGFGIGLFIAQSIIEKHRGKITVESEPGAGSIFTFSIPDE